MNHYLTLQKDGKRFLAGFLDLVFVIVAALLVYMPIQAIAESIGMIQVRAELALTSLATGLFKPDAETGGYREVNEDEYPQALYEFYVDDPELINEEYVFYAPILREGANYNTEDDYYDYILLRGQENTLFDFVITSNGVVAIAKEGKAEEVKQFYQVEIAKAHQILDQHPAVKAVINRYILYLVWTILISFFLGGFIVIVLLPLIFKNQQSIGKLLTKSIVVNGLGYKVGYFQGLLRNVAIFIFSIVFFFMPFHIISFFLMYFSKKKRSLYDRLTVTQVADKESTLIFASANEEAAYRKDLAQKLLEVDRRKAESRREEKETQNSSTN